MSRRKGYALHVYENTNYRTWKQVLADFTVDPEEYAKHHDLADFAVAALERRRGVYRLAGPTTVSRDHLQMADRAHGFQIPNLAHRTRETILEAGYVQVHRGTHLINLHCRKTARDHYPDMTLDAEPGGVLDPHEKIRLSILVPGDPDDPRPRFGELLHDLPILSPVEEEGGYSWRFRLTRADYLRPRLRRRDEHNGT